MPDVCFGCNSEHSEMLAVHEKVGPTVSFVHGEHLALRADKARDKEGREG